MGYRGCGQLFAGRFAGLAALVTLLALVLTLGSAGDASSPSPIPAGLSWSGASTQLLDPVKQMLSGRAWLMAEGLDPALRRRPGWDTLTRLDWRQLEGPFASPSPLAGAGTGTLQAPGAVLVPFRNPAPAFSRDLLITRDFSQIPIQTEPHVAANPKDPDHVVMSAIDYNFPALSTYVSLDGGASWEGPFQVPYLPQDRVSGGDPVLAFGLGDDLYLAMISIGVEDFAVGPLFLSAMVSSIAVARSQDGGFSWPQTISTARSQVRLENQQIDPTGRLRGILSIGFLDKPWMAVGRHPQDPAREVIYITYTDFITRYEIRWVGELPTLVPREVETTIRLVRSEDRGRSWSDPVAVSPTVRRSFGELEQPSETPGRFGTDRVVQGSRPVVAPDGTLYVAWMDSTDDGSMKGLGEIHVARSQDGGKSFSRPVIASVFNEVPFRPRNAFFRYWASAFPKLATGPEGEVYLTYVARPAEKPADDGDVYFLRSLDRGESWSRPLRLNDDDGSSLQFFSDLAVGPDGKIHVMWGDMRDDTSQTRYHIYYTRSEDGGNTWGFEVEELSLRVRDTRVTDFGSNPNKGFPYGLFIGDYFGISATEEDVYMVWADTRLGEFGGANQKIGFARQRAIRSPSLFVSPPAGVGGQQITIQGFDFQPEMNVFIQLQDAVIAAARTNSAGRFTTTLFVPVTGEGAQQLTVLDESGNAASTSYYTEFGFDNLPEIYEGLSVQIEQLRKAIESLGTGGGAGAGGSPGQPAPAGVQSSS